MKIPATPPAGEVKQTLKTLSLLAVKANRFRLILFALLGTASIICVGLLRVRFAMTGSLHYAFLVWNLFLAWIPFTIAYLMYLSSLNRRWILVILPVGAFVWLIFFPNTLYILTDFQHLSTSANEFPVWYDVLLLIWFAFTGLFLGVVSLFMMQDIVRRTFGFWMGWGFIALVTMLASLGVYMGRFLRWNSWDILRYPWTVAYYSLHYAANPSLRAISFTAVFSLFFLFIYSLLYAFAHMLNENR